jgi:hypothetical protein
MVLFYERKAVKPLGKFDFLYNASREIRTTKGIHHARISDFIGN